MGAFVLIDSIAEIAKHNQSSSATNGMKVKESCIYHKIDFEKLSDGQKGTILRCGHEVLMIQQAS
jgi:hypothetical protein